MLRGSEPPSWFAPYLQGAFRIREFEIFIRDLTVIVGDSRYIRMEAEFKRNYSSNCKIESSSWWDCLKRRRRKSLHLDDILYLPNNLEDLDSLKLYLKKRGLFNSKSNVALLTQLEYLKENGGEND